MPLFPYKLHELLTEMQLSPHLSSIISWVPSGNAFKIHQPELFQEIILKKHFPRQTNISSFKRQLLYWNFDNLGQCIFAHPCFLKDKRHLCGQINHSNPTKSQRKAKISIPSRRIRGKRAKQAMRHQLFNASSSFALAGPQLATPFSLALPTTISNKGDTTFSFTQELFQSRATPMEYWGTMNSITTPPVTSTSAMGMADFQKDQSSPLVQCTATMLQMNQMSGQSRMAFAQLLQKGETNLAGLHAVCP